MRVHACLCLCEPEVSLGPCSSSGATDLVFRKRYPHQQLELKLGCLASESQGSTCLGLPRLPPRERSITIIPSSLKVSAGGKGNQIPLLMLACPTSILLLNYICPSLFVPQLLLYSCLSTARLQTQTVCIQIQTSLLNDPREKQHGQLQGGSGSSESPGGL